MKNIRIGEIVHIWHPAFSFVRNYVFNSVHRDIYVLIWEEVDVLIYDNIWNFSSNTTLEHIGALLRGEWQGGINRIELGKDVRLLVQNSAYSLVQNSLFSQIENSNYDNIYFVTEPIDSILEFAFSLKREIKVKL